MKHVLFAFPLVSMLAVTVACGGDDENGGDDDGGSSGASSSSSSGGSSSSSSSGASGSSSSSGGSSSSSGGSSSSSSGSSGAPCVDEVFVAPADATPPLDPATYEDYLGVDAAFPFDVVGFYTTALDFYDSATLSWGTHGGPLAVENDEGALTVHRLVPPAAATGALTDSTVTLQKPADLPAGFALNYPPVTSLPDNHYLLGYTGSDNGSFPSVVYLFDGETSKGRAFANALYAAAAPLQAETSHLYFSGFSPLGDPQPAGSVSAVYTAGTCATGLLGAGCVAGTAAIPLGSDNSGPVVVDAVGNVSVASYDADGEQINVRTVTRCASLGAAPATVAPVYGFADAMGTGTFAVVPATATTAGFFVHAPLDIADYASDFADATAFTQAGTAFTAGTSVPQALALGTDASSLQVMNDGKGYLWVALLTDEGESRLAKLRRRPAN